MNTLIGKYFFKVNVLLKVLQEVMLYMFNVIEYSSSMAFVTIKTLKQSNLGKFHFDWLTWTL